MTDVIYKDNDNLVCLGDPDTGLGGLKNSSTGAYLNGATVTLTAIRDAAGATVSGETFPKTMSYVASSNGRYEAVVDKALAIVPGQAYTAVIDVVSGTLDAHWELPLIARTRTS